MSYYVPLVKWSRLYPLTVATGVRLPYGIPGILPSKRTVFRFEGFLYEHFFISPENIRIFDVGPIGALFRSGIQERMFFNRFICLFSEKFQRK